MNPILHQDFRRRVLCGEWLVGTWLNLGSPLVAELAGQQGFDWIVLDHEHGPGGEETMLHQLQALAGTPAVPLVRVAANEAVRFKRALDLGARGILTPMVSSVAEAEATVAALRYPPLGLRGIAKGHRAAAFGANFADYFRTANEQLLNVVQIETPSAIENIDPIAAVEGVDVLFLGPTDLTYQMGISDQFDHPRFQAAVAALASAAKRHGKITGVLLHDPKLLRRFRQAGFTMIALGADVGVLRVGMRQLVETLRNVGSPS